MKEISFKNIKNLNDDEITYLLYLQGADIPTISKIRNMDVKNVEKSIIECKARYRAYEGSHDIGDVIKKLMKYAKEERHKYISSLSEYEIKNAEKLCCSRLFNSSRDECKFYLWFLGEIKSTYSIEYIKAFLKCSDGNIRRICCSALGKIGDLKAEDILIKCTYDTHPQVRQYALKALCNIKSQKAFKRYEEVIKDENEKDYVKRAAQFAMDGNNLKSE